MKTNYKAGKLTCGKKYNFVVKAFVYGSDGKTQYESAESAVKTVQAVPATPTLVSAEVVGAKQIKVTWRQVSDASGYIIYRHGSGDDNDGWEKAGTVEGSGTLSFIDTKATVGHKFFYTVAAYKKVKKKQIKGSMDAKGKNATSVCSGPVITTEQRHATVANIYIQNVEGADGYYLYRKTGSGELAVIATIGKADGETTTYRDEKVAAGETYTYVAVAYTDVDGKKIKGLVGKEGKLVMKKM